MPVEEEIRKGEPVEKALRRLKRKIEREEIIKTFREKRYFEKPSKKRQRKKKDLAFRDMLRRRYQDR